MIVVLNVISVIVGLTASVLTIMRFFKEKFQRKVPMLMLLFITTAIIVLSGLYLSEQRNLKAMKQMIKQNRTNDAKIVAASIIITGWEDVGDYIGYLAQITGFYHRHHDIYQTEYETNDRALKEWQDHLKERRETDKTWRSINYDDLKGLVKAGEDNIEKIANIN